MIRRLLDLLGRPVSAGAPAYTLRVHGLVFDGDVYIRASELAGLRDHLAARAEQASNAAAAVAYTEAASLVHLIAETRA